MGGPKPPPGFTRDPRVLALWVDDQDGALHGQRVRDDGADAFPGPCRGEGDQMGGSVITQQPSGVRIAPDHPTQQNGGEDHPTEEPEQSVKEVDHAPHQEGVSASELDGAGEGASQSAKALRSCSRARLRTSRSSMAAAPESRTRWPWSAPPRITLRLVSSLRCLVASRFFSD